MKKIRYMIEYWVFLSVAFIFNHISQASADHLGRFLGSIWYMVDPKHKNIAMTNIGFAFPEMSEQERKMIIKENFKVLGTTLANFPRISKLNKTNINEIVTFEGTENYEIAKKRGKGVFILTSHLGNWELAAAAQSIRCDGLIAVAKDIHNPYIDRYIKSMRNHAGIDIVKPRNSVFRLLRAVKHGKTIAMLIDQNTLRHEAVFVKFFGKPAATQYAMALMALKTGAAVVPGYIIKNPAGSGYTIRYEEPVILKNEDDKDLAVLRWTQYFTTLIEKHIKASPEQWFWVHNRFKTEPVEEDMKRLEALENR